MEVSTLLNCTLINTNISLTVLLLGGGFRLKGYILLGFYEVIC